MSVSKEIVSYVEKIVNKIQNIVTRPIVKIIKVCSASIIVSSILIMALCLFLIGSVRALTLVMPVWAIYYTFSGVSLLFALFIIRKSNKGKKDE